MAVLQTQFEKFHDVIRTDYDMKADLAQKRDIILDRVQKYVEDRSHPRFERILQGSYIMGTGVIPAGDQEYDIDVGLGFHLEPSAYSAETVRSWVIEAVKGHTDQVSSRANCIRVAYAAGYHVDLVPYAAYTPVGTSDKQFRIANKTNGWRPANPVDLKEHFVAKRVPFAGTEDAATKTDQLRRVVRDLKRWNDFAFKSDGGSSNKPSGLALTLLAIRYLPAPQKTADGSPNDAAALLAIVDAIAKTPGRVTAQKPTPEYEDVLAKLSEPGMAAFKTRAGAFADALREAQKSVDPTTACECLVKHLGSDFPVPPRTESARKTGAPAIVTTSSSG